jgi:hypothetical protein
LLGTPYSEVVYHSTYALSLEVTIQEPSDRSHSRVCVSLKWLKMVLIPLSCSGKGLIAMEGMETLET